MGNQHEAASSDAVLRRPAFDPGIPAPDRALLTARGSLLPPAGQDRPARRRYYLPTDPAKRLATIDGTVTGMTAAGLAALFGTTPLAVGVLVFQGAASWETASNRYALALAGIIATITAALLGIRIVRFGQLTGRAPAETAARTYHGRYLTGSDFDARARSLLRRSQDAIDAVMSAAVCRADVLDRPATSAALAGQEWDIALALREQTVLRAKRAELAAISGGTRTAALLHRQDEAARLADASIVSRVETLERFAAEVAGADAAYRDWQQAAALADVHDRHLDMLARTAADEHGIAEIDRMSGQAHAIRRAFRQPPG